MKNYTQKKNCSGMVAIALAVIFILISSVIMAISSTATMIGIKTINNYKFNQLAHDAAEAGLHYAHADLNNNYITYMKQSSLNSTRTVNLGNNLSYTINFQNQGSDNNLILVTSTGIDNRSNKSKTISQLFRFKSHFVNTPDVPVVATGRISVGFLSLVRNDDLNNTGWSGDSFTYPHFSLQRLYQNSSGGNITENDSNLQNLSGDDLIRNFFGTDIQGMKQNADVTYSSDSNRDYSNELNGESGKVIFIEQAEGTTATINRNVDIGTSDDPVILIVDGDFRMTGFAQFNGIIYYTNPQRNRFWNVDFAISAVNGAVLAEGDINFRLGAFINYNRTILDNISNSYGQYHKVSGSWRDF